ncbi:MAG: Aspartate aminotransferase [Syntrophus sp. PtaU1.Bin005]|jgi:aspartate aminotransferase|uniref:pyridoxal phosphate-dependent aminotransferase n=1 Tax=Syntrophus sp. (in: bacteria) TaxID=48412 RepID=UPI0009C58904|nr:MAG: Aspartate aminotransferase [Syntrophus sp. PtaB.Bin138]OPY81836.1 MAG: Aspartate aminotransferase [Syntrophus sp. PtaU1.Bin005]
MKLASRVSLIKPSPTLVITAKAAALRAEGRDIVDFGAGEPDFYTPEHIKAAAIQAVESNFTRYTAVGGIDELKDAIIRKLQKDNHLSYRRSEIVVSCGAKHTLFNLAQVLFEEGDEVVIPGPYWVSYPDLVLYTGAQPVIVNTREQDGFKLTPEGLERAITERTRALIINSPSNPTGSAYTREELAALAEVVLRHSMMIISDDIYEKILFDGLDFWNIAAVAPALKDRTIVVNGVSKAYAMTGWRIGYAAGPEAVIAAMGKIQSQSTSNPASISQKAAVEALTGDQQVISEMVKEFQRRRDYIVSVLNSFNGVSCLKPQGAFYVFPNVSTLYGLSCGDRKINDSAAMAEYLLEEAEVAVVPGAAFGDDRYIRISYATSMELIEKGLERIGNALMRLK